MNKPLIIYFNDEKMVKSESEQSRFFKKMKTLAQDFSLQVSSVEEFDVLIRHIREDLEIFVFIHIMGEALGANLSNGKYEFQGKSWAVSLKQKYPDCNFLFVTSDISCVNQEILDKKLACNITDIMHSIFNEKSTIFSPQKVKDICNSVEQNNNDSSSPPESKHENPNKNPISLEVHVHNNIEQKVDTKQMEVHGQGIQAALGDITESENKIKL